MARRYRRPAAGGGPAPAVRVTRRAPASRPPGGGPSRRGAAHPARRPPARPASTRTWSSWLWGRCAGQVRPITARRHPGKNERRRRPPHVHVPGQQGRAVERGQQAGQAAVLGGRQVGDVGHVGPVDDRAPVVHRGRSCTGSRPGGPGPAGACPDAGPRRRRHGTRASTATPHVPCSTARSREPAGTFHRSSSSRRVLRTWPKAGAHRGRRWRTGAYSRAWARSASATTS